MASSKFVLSFWLAAVVLCCMLLTQYVSATDAAADVSTAPGKIEHVSVGGEDAASKATVVNGTAAKGDASLKGNSSGAFKTDAFPAVLVLTAATAFLARMF